MTVGRREPAALKLLARTHGVEVDGHFVLSSGRHAAVYVNTAKVMAHFNQVSELAELLIEELKERQGWQNNDHPFEAVVTPPGDVAPMALAISLHFAPHPVCVTPAGIENGLYFFSDAGKALLKDKRALLVDDVCTSGGTLRRLAYAVREVGLIVAAKAALWVRDHAQETEVIGLIHRELPTWDPHECPLCRQSLPINKKLGHGRDAHL